VRAELLKNEIEKALATVRMSPSELLMLEDHIRARDASTRETQEHELQAAKLQLAHVTDRERRLIDARIDGLLDKSGYEERRKTLLDEKLVLRERITNAERNNAQHTKQLREKLELVKTASVQDAAANDADKLSFVKSMSSNLLIIEKAVVVTWKSGFQTLANRLHESCGGPQRDATRIVHQLTKNCLNPQGTDTCTICTPYRLAVAKWRKEIAEHQPTDEERIELHEDMQRQKYAHSHKQMEEINRRKREAKGEPPPTVGP
jgi:hypothetical protein